MSLTSRSHHSSQSELLVSKIAAHKFEPNSELNLNVDFDDFYSLCKKSLSTPPDKKTNRDILLICALLTYLKDFIAMLSQQSSNNYVEVLRTIATHLEYEIWPKNRMIMRNGEKGNKFYIILSGTVDVIIPKKTQCNISKKEYLTYLALLISYKEFDLLNRALNENFEIFPIDIVDLGKYIKGNRSKSSLISNKSDIDENSYYVSDLLALLSESQQRSNESNFGENDNGMTITTGVYINRIKNFFISSPITVIEDEYSEKKMTTIYEYALITQLKTGSKFGDIALTTANTTRTATLITSSECHFGFLSKKIFNDCLSEASIKYRKNIMQFITSTFIFSNFPQRSLNTFFNSFVVNRVKRGDVIMSKGDVNDKILLLKSGEYELTCKLNQIELTELIINLYEHKFRSMKIQDEIYSRKVQTIYEEEKDLINSVHCVKSQLKKIMTGYQNSQKFTNEITKQKEIKVNIISSPDILGINSYEDNNGNSLFDIKCISNEGEYLTLEKSEDYIAMNHSDPTMKLQEKKLTYMKTMKLLERLIDIRRSKLMLFFKCTESEINKKINELCFNTINDTTINANTPPKKKLRHNASDMFSTCSIDTEKIKCFLLKTNSQSKEKKRTLSQLRLPVVFKVKSPTDRTTSTNQTINSLIKGRNSKCNETISPRRINSTNRKTTVATSNEVTAMKITMSSNKKMRQTCFNMNHCAEEINSPYKMIRKSNSTIDMINMSVRSIVMKEERNVDKKVIKHIHIKKTKDFFKKFTLKLGRSVNLNNK